MENEKFFNVFKFKIINSILNYLGYFYNSLLNNNDDII